MFEILRGYVIVSVCGWASLPVVRRLFGALPDRGYSACRCFGWVLSAWIAWLLVWATGRPLTTGLALGSILVVAVCAWGPVLLRSVRRGRRSNVGDLPSMEIRRLRRRLIAHTELLFLAGLMGFVLLERHNPAVDPDSERFMDYAFVRATLRTPGLPLVDPWMAGAPAAYYHFGYALVAFLVRGCASEPDRFLSTAIALPYALLWIGVFGIGAALTRGPRGGFCAALMTLGAGNLEWIRQGARVLHPSSFDWFASSRVIEGAITEVPWFSLLWGDPHPYVIAMPVVACALALVLAATLESEWPGAVTPPAAGAPWVAIGRVAALAILLGAVLAIHPWDYPLLLVSVVAIGLGASGRNRVVLLGEVILAALLAWPAFTPFLEGLALAGRGLGRVAARSDPREWILAYGPPAILLAIASIWNMRSARGGTSRAAEGSAGRRAAFAFTLSAFLMALLCEAVYVRDLFESTPLARMNTVFKAHRFAWLLMGLASPVAMERLLERAAAPSSARLASGRAILILVVAGALVYPVCGTGAWLGARANDSMRPAEESVRAALRSGADAEALFKALRPGDADAAFFLRRSSGPRDVLLEESGDAYTWSSRMSTFSGVPSILGWGNHEAIWRGGWDEVRRRQMDIAAIYADPASPAACDRMRRLDVTWVVAGGLERQHYGGSVDEFRRLARPAFASAGTEIYSVDDLCRDSRR